MGSSSDDCDSETNKYTPKPYEIQLKIENPDLVQIKYNGKALSLSRMLNEKDDLSRAFSQEAIKLQGIPREHSKRVCEQEIALENKKRRLDSSSKELDTREAFIKQEKTKDDLCNKAPQLAYDELLEAYEDLQRLIEIQKIEKEAALENVLKLEMNSKYEKQKYEREIKLLKEELGMMKRTRNDNDVDVDVDGNEDGENRNEDDADVDDEDEDEDGVKNEDGNEDADEDEDENGVDDEDRNEDDADVDDGDEDGVEDEDEDRNEDENGVDDEDRNEDDADVDDEDENGVDDEGQNENADEDDDDDEDGVDDEVEDPTIQQDIGRMSKIRQEAFKNLIMGLCNFLSSSGANIIGMKRMGEIDAKAFKKACNLRFPFEPHNEAVKLGSLWQEKLEYPTWNPFKIVEDKKGNSQWLLDKDDQFLRGHLFEWGYDACQAVMTALKLLQNYSPRGCCVIPELWNYTENRKATLKEVVTHIIIQLKIFKCWETKTDVFKTTTQGNAVRNT